MTGLAFDTIRFIALIAAGVFVLGGVLSAVLLKSISQKLAVASIFALLALLVWSQRSSLENCATLVRDAGLRGSATCTFLGQDVDISVPSGR